MDTFLGFAAKPLVGSGQLGNLALEPFHGIGAFLYIATELFIGGC